MICYAASTALNSFAKTFACFIAVNILFRDPSFASAGWRPGLDGPVITPLCLFQLICFCFLAYINLVIFFFRCCGSLLVRILPTLAAWRLRVAKRSKLKEVD